MNKIIIFLFLVGISAPFFGQNTENEDLSEVVIFTSNYKYLNEVGTEDHSISVELLEEKVANLDVNNSELYLDEYGIYNVTFYIPKGNILAAYDREGKVIRTIEKFENVNLPSAVQNSLTKRFPEWSVLKDIYIVNYEQSKGAKKTYKVTLMNGEKRLKVKLDDKGNYL